MENIPSPELIDLICQHQGAVSEAQLLAAGYSLEKIHRLRTQRILTKKLFTGKSDGRYTLTNLFAFVDGLVVVKWAVPVGIIGRLSALIHHQLSTALPNEVDVCVLPNTGPTWPANLGVRTFSLSPELRNYGVVTGYPSPPNTIPVPIYSPTVAVVQLWADTTTCEEYQLEALWMYRHFIDDEPALQEAADRYQIRLPEHVEFWH